MVELGQRDILLTFARLLSKHKIAYLLSGSFAVSYFGFPRSTHDIDFVIEVKDKDLKKFIHFTRKLGKSYLFTEEEIKEAIKNTSQFNIYHIDTGIKIDFWPIKNTIFETNKFKRSKELVIEKQKIKVVTPEDLILTKLLWSKKIRSERHIKDCIGIVKIQKDNLDMDYLSQWVKKLKLSTLFAEILRGDYEQT